MADPTTPAPAAPAPAAPASTPTPTPASAAPAPAPKADAAPVRRTVITNPAPIVDPEAPAKQEVPATVPQSTIDEMEAGRKALERNRPVASALEAARANQNAVGTPVKE